MRPRLLDLYCGAGGAAMGYHRAGFDVLGVDHIPRHRYPFSFIQADALGEEAQALVARGGFDAIHASPPCQEYSVASAPRRAAGITYPDLVAPTRRLLESSGLPWIIENVPGAPIRPDYKLCGCMFGLPLLRRERWFETSWHGFELRPPCVHLTAALTVTGNGASRGQYGRLRPVLGRNPTVRDAWAAMGIDWMNRRELAQAIPPAYTELLGGYLHEQLAVSV